MSLLWKILKLFLFRLDAERAHDLAHALLRFLGRRPARRQLLRLAVGGGVTPTVPTGVVSGQIFRNPVGLAAGFDKNGELLEALPQLGFGFAEIGTVTPDPQPGNPRPRLFRDVEKQNLFNRMGFNGAGAIAVAENLCRVRGAGVLPLNFRVGVNVGKMKHTPAESAARDFGRATFPFEYLADYLVINVSSPNTPGLRDLQNVDSLRAIVGEVQGVTGKWRQAPPIFLKLAPEIEVDGLESLIPAMEREGVQGWVLTNTWGGELRMPTGETLPGGWSGKILSEISFLRLKAARSLTTRPIISVGGIDSPAEAIRRRAAGADLLQLYTGWVFGGPDLPLRIARAMQTRH